MLQPRTLLFLLLLAAVVLLARRAIVTAPPGAAAAQTVREVVRLATLGALAGLFLGIFTEAPTRLMIALMGAAAAGFVLWLVLGLLAR